jgi:predicted DNA-binding transcriptional regulator YafY
MAGNIRPKRRPHSFTVTMDDEERDALIKHARPFESGADVLRRLMLDSPVRDGASRIGRLRRRKTVQ